ncbi:MAG: glycoside hydrolase family 16 protein, partial [Bacteroidaceae bacterium]|nr:glycoside hydrolase family 16 protein [Bacteroidaceae bacterium]
MKKNIILSAALVFFGLTTQAQTTITFDSEDYKSISVYDAWEGSPFRAKTPTIDFDAAVVANPDTEVDAIMGVAPNASEKVVKVRRSRFGSNTFGVRIDLKEPIRMTKQLQYIHIMAYLKDKPADSRMMVIGLGKRLEESWNWQTGEDEQFWAVTTSNVKAKEGWQDVVVSFKGFSYSKEENVNSGIDIYSLIIVPDVRSPHADKQDWYAYFDEIVVDNNPDKRFSTDKYAVTYDKDQASTRNDRKLNSVGLTAAGTSYTSASAGGKVYTDNTTLGVFSAKAGTEVQPTFNYTGAWMSGYVYVDWNNDGKFEFSVNDNGTPAEGSEIVSYSAAQVNGTWRKSDGTTAANGNTIGSPMPKFTIPAGTPAGFYRMRYKVDWDNLNPAGGSTIVSDGGGYIDVMLDVHADEVTVNASQLNG